MTEIIRIPNISKYSLEMINDELILTPKTNYISESDLLELSLSHSKIKKCEVKDGERIISNSTIYMRILIDILKQIPREEILKLNNLPFNIDRNERNDKGYNWKPELQISIQGQDSNYTIKSILYMIRQKNYSLEISIKLENGNIVHYKNN